MGALKRQAASECPEKGQCLNIEAAELSSILPAILWCNAIGLTSTAYQTAGQQQGTASVPGSSGGSSFELAWLHCFLHLAILLCRRCAGTYTCGNHLPLPGRIHCLVLSSLHRDGASCWPNGCAAHISQGARCLSHRRKTTQQALWPRHPPARD